VEDVVVDFFIEIIFPQASPFYCILNASSSSKIEGKLVQINIRWNVSDLTAINGNFVSQHAWSWDLDRIWPVIVIEAESISKVEDSVL
jgi:hypothetical protein